MPSGRRGDGVFVGSKVAWVQVFQRVRRRIIDYVALVRTARARGEYERRHPLVRLTCGTAFAVFNLWIMIRGIILVLRNAEGWDWLILPPFLFVGGWMIWRFGPAGRFWKE